MKCKYCGNRYTRHIEQCPTCGARAFISDGDDSISTVIGMVGYGSLYDCRSHIEWSKIVPGSGAEGALFDGLKSGKITADQIDYQR